MCEGLLVLHDCGGLVLTLAVQSEPSQNLQFQWNAGDSSRAIADVSVGLLTIAVRREPPRPSLRDDEDEALPANPKTSTESLVLSVPVDLAIAGFHHFPPHRFEVVRPSMDPTEPSFFLFFDRVFCHRVSDIGCGDGGDGGGNKKKAARRRGKRDEGRGEGGRETTRRKRQKDV